MRILELQNLSTQNVAKILKSLSDITQKELNHIYSLACLETCLDHSHVELFENIFTLNLDQIYLNEVRDLLKANDNSLYKQYISFFKSNPGVLEAFGTPKQNRSPYERKETNQFEKNLLDPVFFRKKSRNRIQSDKKSIRRQNKIQAKQNIEKILQEKREYAEKLKQMYKKIN